MGKKDYKYLLSRLNKMLKTNQRKRFFTSPLLGVFVSDPTERKDITDISTTSYLTFNLNVDGKNFINKTGYTKLGLREDHDLLNTPFVGNSGEYNYLHIRSSEYSGTTFDPILEVTYITTVPEPSVIQDLNYTYDNNGNILTIVDATTGDASRTVTYTYDDLNRLLTATATSVASGQTTYTHTYTYDALGNITASPLGAYTYSGTGYINPHAVTNINGIAYTYDNNGNQLTETNGSTNTFNYDNRLVQTVKNGITTTYAYDHTGQRIKQSDGTTTTVYPTKYYNVEGSNITKHIFNPNTGELLATIKGTGSSAQISFIHSDHLGSTEKVTNSLAEISELSDYFPYGDARISNVYSGTSEQRKYIGQEYDTATKLSYLNARYYNPLTGRFLSQDPAFRDIGSKNFQDKYQRTLQEHLMNPQSLNSYAYANNNPIIYSDPEGEILPAFPIILGAVFTTYGYIDASIDSYEYYLVKRYPDQFSQQEKKSAFNAILVDAVTLGTSNVLKGVEAVVFDGLSTFVEIISNKASEVRKNNQTSAGNESLKIDPTSSAKSSTTSPFKYQPTNYSPSDNNRNTPSPQINVNQKLSDTFNKTKQSISNIINNNTN